MATGNPLSLNVQCLLIMYNFMISYDQLTRTKLAQSLQVSCPHFDFLFFIYFFRWPIITVMFSSFLALFVSLVKNGVVHETQPPTI